MSQGKAGRNQPKYPDAAACLVEKKNEIMEKWSARARQRLPKLRRIPDLILQDSLPEWIDCLAEVLRTPNRPFLSRSISQTARKHGSQRTAVNFEFNELLLEYEALRHVLLEVLESSCLIQPNERDVILDAIDTSINNAASEYSKSQRNSWIIRHVKGSERSRLRRYCITILIFSVCTAFQWVLWPVIKPYAFFMYYPAMTLAALFGDGWVAIGLAILLSETLFIQSSPFPVSEHWGEFFRSAIFALNSVLVLRVTAALRYARDRAEQARSLEQNARNEADALRADYQEALRREKIAHEDAQEALASLNSLIANAPIGIGFVDTQLRCVRVNEGMEQFSSIRAEDQVGRHVRELALSNGNEIEGLFKRVLSEGKAITNHETSFSEPFRSSDPLGRVYALGTIYPVKMGEKIIGAGLIAMNITQRKKEEAQLRLIQERYDLALTAGNIGIWDMDTKSGKITWSDRMYEIYGLESKSVDLTYDQVLGFVHPEDRGFVHHNLKQTRTDGRGFEFEYRILTQDGKTRWLHVIGRPMVRRNGDPIRVLGTVVDITSRKEIEQSRLKTLQMLQEEQDLREQFVSLLSHDLRTPLTAARLSAQIIQKKPNEKNSVEIHSGRIVRSIDRVDTMIRDLLDVNRIRVGRPVFIERRDADLREVTKNAIEGLSMIHGNRFQLRIEHQSDDTAYCGKWDADGIRRIIENLCANAVKYGSVSTPITVLLTEARNQVIISVHNEGNPISPEDQTHLFEYFHRAKKAQISEQKGWGVGLTLVKGVAEAHGGSVSVSSSPAFGTTFTVKLPKNFEEKLSA